MHDPKKHAQCFTKAKSKNTYLNSLRLECSRLIVGAKCIESLSSSLQIYRRLCEPILVGIMHRIDASGIPLSRTYHNLATSTLSQVPKTIWNATVFYAKAADRSSWCNCNNSCNGDCYRRPTGAKSTHNFRTINGCCLLRVHPEQQTHPI